jgi:hypothetical protein
MNRNAANTRMDEAQTGFQLYWSPELASWQIDCSVRHFIVTGHSKTPLHLRMSVDNIQLAENDLTDAIVSP